MIHASHLAHVHEKAAEIGIAYGAPEVDYAKVYGWQREIVGRLTKGIEKLVSSRGADIRMAQGKLLGGGKVELRDAEGKTEVVETKNVILAGGSRPVEIPGFSYSDERIWDSTRALGAQEAPEAIVIVGGGVIGLELGQVFAGFGTEVTVIEMMDQILPGMPRDLIQPLQRRLREQGIKVLTKAKALGYDEGDGRLQMRVEVAGDEQVIPCTNILVTVGRRPNSENLNLQAVGLRADKRGFVPVNERLETGASGVYAIGDLTGGPLLAHRASKMGEVCADVIAGKPAAFDATAVPSVVYTSPEIAMSGLTEEQAREEGYKVISGKFPFAACGRAMTMQETRGFIKVIADGETQAILGVQAVGANVSEMIAEGTLAVEMGAVLHDVAGTVHPHPTLSEALMEAALAALGEAIHILPR